MAHKDTFIGTGTTLSSSYYLRSFYHSNRNAITASKREDMGNTALTLADSHALHRALRQLTSSDFTEEQDTNARNRVQAYIETYNNMLSSASDSSDHTLERNVRQLKNVTKEYSSELDKIGITINKDGTLTSRESLFKNADLSKFEKLFSNKSEYMQRASAYAKRLVRRSEVLTVTENQERLRKRAAGDNAAAAAQPVSESTDLDTLLNTGIGRNVNVVL